MNSPKYSLNKTDLIKITKGAAIAIGGAVVAYAATVIGELDQSTIYGALIAAIGGVLINAARKWLADNQNESRGANDETAELS